MSHVNQIMVEVLNVAVRALNNGETSTMDASTPTPTSSSTPAATTSPAAQQNTTTQSPLLFFVALGFGVVFTNLWIIVGVKYCFRYNARNRALARGENIDGVNLEVMPRPHRRRREKKLMTMDEVNERFPLTKYKTWAATRAAEGLPTAGGVTAPPSRAVSLRDVDGVIPSSPTETKHSLDGRPTTATSAPEIITDGNVRKSLESPDKKTATVTEQTQHMPPLKEVTTTATIDPKDVDAHIEEDSEDDEDHIHDALAPELLDHPGDSCAICIDTLEEDDDIRGLTCGHAFHAGCLDPWLTSRRACCPLCKADYFIPKPRPEGEEVVATERHSRRHRGLNMPQHPRSVWAMHGNSSRNSPRVMPGRFLSPLYPGPIDERAPVQNDRNARRAARRAAAAQQASGAGSTQPTDAPDATDITSREPSSGMFSGLRFPRFGRNRTAESTVAPSEPTPAQLEAGSAAVVR